MTITTGAAPAAATTRSASRRRARRARRVGQVVGEAGVAERERPDGNDDAERALAWGCVCYRRVLEAAPRSASVTRLAVIGAGSWGTDGRRICAARTPTVLWGRDPELVDDIARDTRTALSPGVALPTRCAPRPTSRGVRDAEWW